MERWVRRIVSVGGYTAAAIAFAGLSPLLLACAAARDAARASSKRWPAVRFLCMVGAYLLCELIGILAALGLWLFVRDPGRSLDLHYRLQWWWASSLLRAVRRLFGMKFQVEGADACLPGPILLLIRHASTADTLLPAALVSSQFRLRLRYVLKRELLWDPCLDIVGQRLPNVFVRRGSGDSAAEVAAVQRLAEGLGEKDGVLIFPEGTRFSSRRRAEILGKLERSAEPRLLERARRLAHVLPPRLGGTLGLLEQGRGVDVVFCAHTGFEGVRRMSDLWNGALVDRTIKVYFWRCSRAGLPQGTASLTDWLFDEWQRMDDWVARNQAE